MQFPRWCNIWTQEHCRCCPTVQSPGRTFQNWSLQSWTQPQAGILQHMVKVTHFSWDTQNSFFSICAWVVPVSQPRTLNFLEQKLTLMALGLKILWIKILWMQFPTLTMEFIKARLSRPPCYHHAAWDRTVWDDVLAFLINRKLNQSPQRVLGPLSQQPCFYWWDHHMKWSPCLKSWIYVCVRVWLYQHSHAGFQPVPLEPLPVSNKAVVGVSGPLSASPASFQNWAQWGCGLHCEGHVGLRGPRDSRYDPVFTLSPDLNSWFISKMPYVGSQIHKEFKLRSLFKVC